MLSKLFGHGKWQAPARALYGAIVEAARRPEFYLRCAVPDTLDGRFDLLALHAFLVLHRLRGEGRAAAGLAQAVFDLMFADMDGNLRELGVSDLAVGGRVKTMARALNGRIHAYEPGLADPDVLAAALGRNLYRGGAVAPEALARMVGYVRAAAGELAAQGFDSLAAGRVRFAELEPA